MSDPVVAFVGVTKAFRGHIVFNDQHLTILGGERLLLVGPNASGKSTFLRLLSGLSRPNAGAVRWTLPKGALVAYLPQAGGYLPELTLAENARVIASAIGQPHRSLADEQALLGDFGLTDYLHAPLSILSEGTRRLVVLLSMVCLSPAVLLADEPFAGIDDENVDALSTLMNEYLPSNAISVLSSHEAFKAHSSVLRLDGGRIIRS